MNKNEINNEMTIIYKNDENKIKLFDKDFINNNKDNCYLIINNEKTELKEYLEINNNKLKQIEIKLYETKPITNMRSMFSSCSSLQSLPDISKWNTENVTDMSYMFDSCSSLQSLPDISKWKLNKELEKIDMFKGVNINIIPKKFK